MSLKRRKPSVMHAVGDQTPAVRHQIASVNGLRGARGTTRRKRRAKSTSSRPRKRRASKGGKMTKGSAAAKAWGRKMRRARKK